MSFTSFVKLMRELAYMLTVPLGPHQDFIYDVRVLCNAIQTQLYLDNATFKDHLGQLDKTAALVDDLNLDMPLNFQLFLPVRLPVPVTATYDDKNRTVQFTRPDFEHPFFLGNAVNYKRMNLLLQKEIERAVDRLGCVCGYTGAIYDLNYTVWCYQKVPFIHQLVAVERGPYQRCIRFDFVLALEFDGTDVPLPPCYEASISHRWIAYGMVPPKGSTGIQSSTEWAVLVPKWQSAGAGNRLRELNTMILLHRLLRAQQCDSYALPVALKLGFSLTTEERGESYQELGVADLLMSTFGHMVFCNFWDIFGKLAEGDKDAKRSKFLEVRKQQLRAKGIFFVLVEAMRTNTIDTEFTYGLFRYIYIPPPPICYWQSVEDYMTKMPILDNPCLPERRRSI
ncbi:uncharacterized protein [Drosophila bipectinata]|uniref:uncharacterized protein n=1 Tax=Drosophila bipectinata TaxID=42026 RepID=UPI001C8A36F0|nr:uncharacterized protein LOC108119648 [Drosophila bipectinata]